MPKITSIISKGRKYSLKQTLRLIIPIKISNHALDPKLLDISAATYSHPHHVKLRPLLLIFITSLTESISNVMIAIMPNNFSALKCLPRNLT